MSIVDSKAVDVNSSILGEGDTLSMLGDVTPLLHASISEEDLRARFAKNLRNLRTLQGISQEALGDLAGVHRTFISQVERGLRSLSLGNIGKLANALGVDPMELFKP